LGLVSLAFVGFIAKSLPSAPAASRATGGLWASKLAKAATRVFLAFLFAPAKAGGIPIKTFVLDLANPMIPQRSNTPQRRDARPISGFARIGSQPIALSAAALCLILAAGISITAWRVYTGHTPETDRAVAVRVLQARTAQASEQLVEKTKGLEVTQQESIDQLQMVQDQLQTVRRLLAAQQSDTRKLSEQVGTLTEAVESLRQSFASAQASDSSAAPSPRKRSAKARPRATRSANRSRAKARG
jgi:hypothetical protein